MFVWANKPEDMSQDLEYYRQEIGEINPIDIRHWAYPWSLKHARLREGMRVLDGGCGQVPRLTWYAARHGAQAWAVDKEKLPRKEHRWPEIGYGLLDLSELAFRDEWFDRIISVSVFEHIEIRKRPLVMREFARVLRQGGKLIMTVCTYVDGNPTKDPGHFHGNQPAHELLEMSKDLVPQEEIPSWQLPALTDDDIFFRYHSWGTFTEYGIILVKDR